MSKINLYCCLLVLVTLVSLPNSVCAQTETKPDTLSLFVSGTNGYKSYRIPAIITTTKGTLLAFCEGRKNNAADAGYIDLLVKRSTDGGRSWSEQQVIWNDSTNTCGNPCPLIDQTPGTFCLLTTHNVGDYK